ncbi:MAG: GNAT family N-acetyltransferase [Saprospiraceae bacterium]|nr:GNAT family N-acetyltransferase [Saprospiraceae bacterium]
MVVRYGLWQGMWQYITETDADGFIVGILPYSIKRKLFFKLITMSPETSYGGPFIIKSKERKTNSQISFENNILESIIKKVPKVDFVYFQCKPDLLSYLPFLWQKYIINISYTYRIDLRLDIQLIHSQMKGSTRTDIKRCQNEDLITQQSKDVPSFIEFLKSSFTEKSKGIPYKLEQIAKIITETINQECGFILYCKNRENEIVAGIFVMFDKDTAYYYAGTNYVSKFGSAALSFCIWESIKLVKSKGIKYFDFEGSDIRGIEHYFRNFGGDLLPIYRVHKSKKHHDKVVGVFSKQKIIWVND